MYLFWQILVEHFSQPRISLNVIGIASENITSYQEQRNNNLLKSHIKLFNYNGYPSSKTIYLPKTSKII